MDPKVLLYAFFGGLLPAALWLWFWLKEDSAHPEPRGLIVITFGAGMVSVIITLALQQLTFSFLDRYFQGGTTILFLFLALIEEAMKFFAAYIVALRNRAFDEPIDAVIYMVTAALGFSALENAIFLFNPLMMGDFVDSVITGNMRFVGASVLHVMTSAIVGLGLAFAFYRPKIVRRRVVLVSLITATILHTLFNLSIMSDNGGNMFVTFLVLWCSVIGLLLFFEKIKRLNQINTI